ncbi:MAG: glutathione synthase [Deltaproteobacteria bacterium]|nr:glutathione synthase [Deltaproteobacteria bacterium]MBW2417561.1 glutathione synthase [Deltaproteobacteria bacterium]
MPASPLSMAFVMDPIESISIDADTTFALMLEAQRRGHELLYVDPGDLGVTDGQAAALATPVTLRREPGRHFELGRPRPLILDESVDVAFQRVDPPVDEAYTLATQILGTCRRTLVLNRPQSVLAFNEKLFALHFRELMTETMVSRNIAELEAFMESLGGEMIVKPLTGKGGEGIFHLVKGERNLSSVLEQATRFETQLTMAQRYLPEVRRGDKRILLLDGEFLGAVLRVPADAEVRANLHIGGRAARAELSEADRRILERIGPVLRSEGLFFVGIDVIGDYLTEINVTSPTGVQEVNALEGTRIESKVIERVESWVAEGRR